MSRVAFDLVAARQLERLNKQLARRILTKIEWLAQNAGQFPHEALHGPLKKSFKLRVGEYRVIYTLESEEETLTVQLIGHRREIYKRP